MIEQKYEMELILTQSEAMGIVNALKQEGELELSLRFMDAFIAAQEEGKIVKAGDA